MADSFFGFDTTLSNLNDDEGGGGDGSEDEYDALNDETFGIDSDDLDWEVEHEQLAEQLESSRHGQDSINSQLEASLSKLVLDETDSPISKSFNTNVWQNDVHPFNMPTAMPQLKNVCTVEELERQLRQKPSISSNQPYFQPRFPVILQRPPGLQAPVSLPFAPQQSSPMGNMQMNQINKILGQTNNTTMPQNNQMFTNTNNQYMQNANHMMQNQFQKQMNQSGNQLLQNQMNQLGQNNQMMQNQISQSNNQLMQNLNQMNQSSNQLMQNVNKMNQSNHMMQNQIGQPGNQMMQINHMTQMTNQINQNSNQMMQNMNQNNQMLPNGNQFGSNLIQQHNVIGQPRMMAPMGLGQNFNSNMAQFNPNFRPPTMDQPPMSQNVLNQSFQNQMQTKAQSPQHVKSNQTSQSPQNKPNQKLAQNAQKPRTVVYNNGAQKNLTSQNLVQIIQNTHPMLNFNSGFHNASHHPILNNRNVINNHPMFNQRLNGVFVNSNSRHLTNGDDMGLEQVPRTDGDEYAGLMTQREKQWLLNIQMLQLNTGTPYIEDFYYTVFLERQSKKEKEGIKEAHKANQQNHPFYSGNVNQEQRSRHNSGRHNSTSEDAPTPRTYVPTQFENSLGKLQCGSVTAPRKIIDVDVVQADGNNTSSGRQSRAASVASTTNATEAPHVRRTKQVLLDIEALYLILLRLEELNEPLAISNALIMKEREEKQKQLEIAQKEEESDLDDSNVFLRNIESVQRKPKVDTGKESVDKRTVVNLTNNVHPVVTKNLLDENKDEIIGRIFAGLLHEDRLQQFVMVRKGKALLARFLSRVPTPNPLLRMVWSRVLRALPGAARRDDGSLVPLATHFRRYVQSSSGWAAVLEASALISEALDPARTPHSLTSPFTMSVVCYLVERAYLLSSNEATSNERQWIKFLKTVARALKTTSLKVAKPLHPLPESKLAHHIKILESRTVIEILQRGKTTSEFADLSKSDFSEQLTKHLC